MAKVPGERQRPRGYWEHQLSSVLSCPLSRGGGGDGVRDEGGEEGALITCSSLLTPSCVGWGWGSGAKDTGTPRGEKGSWLRKACLHLERERGLPGAQWPIRGPEKIGRLPPLSGTLQEACSCGEESMAPGPCFMPPAGCRVGRGVRRPPSPPSARCSPPSRALSPWGAPCPLGRG